MHEIELIRQQIICQDVLVLQLMLSRQDRVADIDLKYKTYSYRNIPKVAEEM